MSTMDLGAQGQEKDKGSLDEGGEGSTSEEKPSSSSTRMEIDGNDDEDAQKASSQSAKTRPGCGLGEKMDADNNNRMEEDCSEDDDDEGKDEESEKDNCDDRSKGSATSRSSEEGVEDDDDQSSSSGSESETKQSDSEPSKQQAIATADGDVLSEYELQRLERIRRNKEYLMALGLEEQNNAMRDNNKRKQRQTKPKQQQPQPPEKKRESLRAKKLVDYSEPATTIASIVRATTTTATTSENSQPPPARVPKNPKRDRRREKKREDRMEKFVYLEFQAVKAHKKEVLRQAEKDLNASKREVKYWSKLAEKEEIRRKRREESTRVITEYEQEKAQFGCTLKDLLLEVDSRTPELMEALRRFDDEFQAEERAREKEAQRLEAENKLKTLDALDRFPKALKDNVSLLNSVLLERAPNDPPPPRRSQRATPLEQALLEPQEQQPQSPNRSSNRAKKRNNNTKSSSSDTQSGALSNHDVAVAADWGEMLSQTLQASSPGCSTSDGVVAPEVVVSDGENTAIGGGSLKRKRNLRNVGGWISPAFAEQIDRSWLNRDSSSSPQQKQHGNSSTCTTFDPSNYVPQVGECVLYYPIGHKEHLKYYPDVLGKKTRSATRIPLWEREKSASSNPGGDDDEVDHRDNKSADAWLSPDWLSAMEANTCNYPILCRVESAHAEFPPDPYTKVVKKKKHDGAECDEVSWKPPKDLSILKRIPGTPLRLAVELRPLTSVILPDKEEDTSSCPPPLPPVFSIVTFPTDLEPFLIPFSWAYTSHCLSPGDSVTYREEEQDDGSKLRVEGFGPIPGADRTCRLEEHFHTIERIISRFDESLSCSQIGVLEELLSSAPREFPPRDGRFIVEVLRRFLETRGSENPIEGSVSLPASTDLFGLVRRTLPLWSSVSLVKSVNKRKKYWVSPWLLAPSDYRRLYLGGTPDSLASASNALEEALRTKIAFVLEDLSSRHEYAGLFYYDISEEDAPSYGCAVPAMMSFEKILRRLGAEKTASTCYYRSVEAILCDIGMILENCLLYNSPDAEVVGSAVQIVSDLKGAVSRTVQSHFQESRHARLADEDRRRLVSHSLTGQEDYIKSNDGLSAQPPVAQTVRIPYRDEVEQEWLQQFSSSSNCAPSSTSHADQSCQPWYPQAGDRVLYSKRRHETFIKAHFRSLESEHCILPRLSTNRDSSDEDNLANLSSDWTQGTVVWVRVAFPKAPSKKSVDDANTFLTSASLSALGIQLDSKSGTVVYWRPCLLDCDHSEGAQSSCPACGLCCPSSFLQSNSSMASDLSDTCVSAIDRCLSHLKRRCIRQEPYSSIDPNLTREKVRNGYSCPPARVGVKPLPSFGGLFSRQQPKLSASSSSIGTRGVSSVRDSDAAALPLLVEAGFLPFWVSTSTDTSADMLARHRMVSPWPKLSLELVLLRLKHGFYRRKAAIENDIIEAYVNQVILLLSEDASRKKSPVSMKRIARILSSIRVKIENVDATSAECALAEEERDWAARIQKIRELHAMALLAVNETQHMERLMGLVSDKPSSCKSKATSTSRPCVDPARAHARSKIEMLLSAVSKDQVQKTSNGVISTRIAVKCIGEIVSHARYFWRESKAEAVVDGKTTKVIVACDGKAYASKEEARTIPTSKVEDKSDLTSTSSNAKSTSKSSASHLVKVSIRCRGAKDAKRHESRLTALVPGPLGDKNLKRVVNDSIRLTRRECEGSDTLVRFLVAQSGKMDQCARCQVYHRSFFECRVALGHTNIDFDWASSFNDNSGIDGLISALHPRKYSPQDVHTNVAAFEPISRASDGGGIEAVLTQRRLGSIGEDAKGLVPDQSEPGVEPIEQLGRARKAVSLAIELVQEAKKYFDAPPRLSQDFIKSSYPVDPHDGHYIYCTICGLSGDLVCCDGCANVFHQNCLALKALPEGDWFCMECVVRRTAAAVEGCQVLGTGASNDTKETREDSIKGLPFGRVVFDEAKAESLSKLLGELNAARPDQKITRLPECFQQAPSDGIPLKRPPGRPRKRPLGESSDIRADDDSKKFDASYNVEPAAAEDAHKRPRGRPRKRPTHVDGGKPRGKSGQAEKPESASADTDDGDHEDDKTDAQENGQKRKRRSAEYVNEDQGLGSCGGKRQFKRQRSDSLRSHRRESWSPSAPDSTPPPNANIASSVVDDTKEAERQKRRQWRRARRRQTHSEDPEEEGDGEEESSRPETPREWRTTRKNKGGPPAAPTEATADTVAAVKKKDKNACRSRTYGVVTAILEVESAVHSSGCKISSRSKFGGGYYNNNRASIRNGNRASASGIVEVEFPHRPTGIDDDNDDALANEMATTTPGAGNKLKD